MSLESLIRERRTVRKFNNLPVSEALVKSLLQKSEQLCPHDGESQWRYVYVGTDEARERLSGYISEKVLESRIARLTLSKVIESYQRRFLKIPAYLIAIADTDHDPIKNEEIYGTICRILQNFQLLSWEQQLGMAWITEPIIQNELFYKRIGLKEGERFVGMLEIGYFDKSPKARARTTADRYWTDFVYQ